VANLTRFNAQGVGLIAAYFTDAATGQLRRAYTSLLTQPRVMQFALRYEF